MKYLEAPNTDRYDVHLLRMFLAGGITGCPDWQAEVKKALKVTSVVLLNPRRATFDVTDGSAAVTQIKWEQRYLRRADVILFWFPCETLCPIALFELGAALERPQTVIVGCHPKYQRITDVQVQLSLMRPQKVHQDLDELIGAAKDALARKFRPVQ